MTLGARIREARLAAGLRSQAALAEACGWESPSRVGNYEQDTREPSLEDLRSIAKATAASGFSYAWLVVGPEELAASQAARLDPAKLAASIEALRQVARNQGLTYDPVTHANETALTYELACALGAAPSTSQVIDFGDRVAAILRRRAEADSGRSDGEEAGGTDSGRAPRRSTRRKGPAPADRS